MSSTTCSLTPHHRDRPRSDLRPQAARRRGSTTARRWLAYRAPVLALALVVALIASSVLPPLSAIAAVANAPDLAPTPAPVVDCPPESGSREPRRPVTLQSTIAPAATPRWSVDGFPAIAEMSSAISTALQTNAVTFEGKRGVVSAFRPGPIYPEIYARDLASIHLVAPYLYPDAFLRSSTEEFLFRQWTGPREPLVPGQPPFPAADALNGIITITGADDKSTATSDEEPSIVYSAARYARLVGGPDWLACRINGRTVLDRLDAALLHLVTARRDAASGLIVRAHTTDWGDVRAQPTGKATHHDPTHERWTASIYDQAVVYQAMRELSALHRMVGNAAAATDWEERAAGLCDRANRFLWQPERGFYRPHLHLTSYRHPFDEDAMVSIANAVAVASGLANDDQAARIFAALEIARTAAAVSKPGLSIYPPYDWHVWEHPLMGEWSYQNGGQWDWWGAVQIAAEFATGHSDLAFTHLTAVAEEWRTHPNNILEWQHPFGAPYHGSEQYAAAGGTMGHAIIHGLFGVELALDGFTLRPRLGARDGSLHLEQPATNSAVTLRQRVQRDAITVEYTVRHPTAGTLAVLLPNGMTAANVFFDDAPWPFRIERIGEDVYADLGAVPAGTHRATIPLRPDELARPDLRVTLDRLPAVLPATARTPVLAAVEAPTRSQRVPATQVRARWLAPDGSDRPDLAPLMAHLAPSPAASVPQTALVTTPATPGEYRLRWEFVGPGGVVLPQPLQEAVVRIATQPLRAAWIGTVQDGVVLAGSQFEMPVALENAGTETWRATGTARVQIGAYWTTPDGTPAGVAALAPLPEDVMPGESVRLVVKTAAPAAPGRYRLTWDLVKAGEVFAQQGSPTLSAFVTVVARP